MHTVLNCLDKEQAVTVGGHYFDFKPKQMRYFHNKDLAGLCVKINQKFGFVALPDEFDIIAQAKPDQREKLLTPELDKILSEKQTEGVEAYCRTLREFIYNETVSLQRDLDMKNIKVDARVYASPKTLERMQELVKYQKSKQDLDENKINKMKELEKQIGSLK